VAPVAADINDDRPAVHPQHRRFDRQPVDVAPRRNDDQRDGGQGNRLKKRFTHRDLQQMTERNPEDVLDAMTMKVVTTWHKFNILR
jgi:hypothetical protein